MADVNAKIGVSIDASAALAELKSLQRQLAAFHSSLSKGSAASVAAQKNLSTNLLNSINATGKFSAQMGLVRSSTESFTHSLEKNKLSMREYFRYAGGSTRTFGKLFKQEFNTIGKVAEERVKKMQTQYIKMGRDASGAIKAMSITPRTLDMNDYATKTALAAQKQALLNQLLKQGSTNLLNFGKNTQWAGRQLMVGFTIPLAYFGTAAAKTFMDLEKQAIKFKRVYGDMFTTTDETNKALGEIQKLAESFTKYGVAVTQTMEMAASAAAMGKMGADLTAQVSEATRLAVLGGVEQAQALETTISVTNAFGIASEDLANKINFLNSVENQTILSIEDLTEAIPKAGPVVKQLGGSVEDLAFFMTAMKEGGINASEGANALKSGLASLINPSKKASEMLAGFGVNIKGIVEANQGDIKNTVIGFAQALDTLDPLNRARAIEQLFGKFQFSRLSTLFQNVTKEGTQANKVLQLTNASIEELAILAERELGTVENAIGVDFKESVEKLKLAIVPIGKAFLEAITPVVKFLGRLLDKFDNLGEGTKKFIVVASALVGIIGPVLLMTFGLLANGVANIIKLFVTMRVGFLKAGSNTKVLADQTSYLNSEQLEAATVAASLNQAHTRLTQSFSAEASAVRLLRQAYIDATIAATNFARANPGMMGPGAIKGGKTPKKFASGTTGVVGGTPGKDSIPSLLMPGEAVIPTGIAQDDKYKPIVEALVTGKIKQYGGGTVSAGDDYTHVGGGRLTNIDDIIAQGRLTKNEKLQAQIYRDILKATGKYPEARAYGSLALSFDPNLNKGLATKNGVSLIDFEREWTSRPNKWAPSGLTSAQAQSIDSAMMDQIRRSPRVTDAVIENAFKNVPDNIKSTPAYQKMLSQYDRIGGYSLGRGLGSTPETSAKVLEQAKRAGIIKDFRVETRQRQSGATATKSLIIKTNDGKEVSLGRGSKANRIYFSDKSLAQGYQPTASTVAGKTGSTIVDDIRRIQQARYDREDNALLEAMRGGTKPKIAVAPGEGVIDNKGRASQVTPSTGNSKTKDTTQIGGSKRDTRLLDASKVMRVIPRPGFKGPGSFALGADGGWVNPSVTTPGSGFKMGNVAPMSSIAPNINVPGTQLQQLITSLNANTEATDKLTQPTTQSAKDLKREQRAQRAQRVGSVAGPAAGALGMASMGAFMTGNNNLGMGLMGASAVTSMLPMLMNPYVAAAAAAAALAGGFLLLSKNLEQSAKKQAEFVKATSGTAQKMEEVGKITGAVGASQIMERRRRSGSFGAYNDAQRAGSMFGDKFLQSDLGKNMVKGFVENMEKFGSKQAASDFALQLSTYVSDGVLTAEQAEGIAEQIGIQLGNQKYGIEIKGNIRSIIGPNGEDLAKDPLRIRTQIIAQAIKRTDKELTRLSKAESGSTTGRNEAARIAAVGANNLEIIQAQADATNMMYQKQIDLLNKQLETTASLEKQLQIKQQISDLETNQATDVSKINTMLSDRLQKEIEIFKTRIQTKDQFAIDLPFNDTNMREDAYFDSLKSTVKDAYKGTEYEGLASNALKRLSKLSDLTGGLSLLDGGKTKSGFGSAEKAQELEVQMSLLLKNKILNPEQSNALLDLFAGKLPELQQTLALGIRKQGSEKTVAMLDFFTGLDLDKEKAVKISTQIINSDPATFDKIGEALAALQVLDGHEVNMSAYIETVGYDGLVKLADKLSIVEKLPKKLSKKIIIQSLKDGALNGTGLDEKSLELLMSQWKDFDALPDSIQKEAISKFVTIRETRYADLASANAAAAQNIDDQLVGLTGIGRDIKESQLIAEGAGSIEKIEGVDKEGEKVYSYKISDKGAAKATKEYLPKEKTSSGNQPGGAGLGGGDRDTTLDDLLRKLKMTRDAGIDAEGGIGELNRIFKESGGDMTKFTGVIQQLNDMGANLDFVNFIEGLDNKTQAAYLNVAKLKEGFVELTPVGEKAMQLMQEAGLGGFAAEADTAITAIKMQTEGFIRLREAGVSVADSLEMMSDEQFMYDLQQAKSIELQDKLIAKYNERVAAEQKLLEDTDPEKAFDIQMNKAMKYYDFLEKQARAAAQPEIDRVNGLIDANEKLIDIKQRSIEMDYDRPIEKLNQDLAIINKAADDINKKYDKQEKALEKISSLNQEIAEQERGRLNLADALTSGDISAAARAAQEMRATDAANAIQISSNALQTAKESEISALTAGGFTRAQIEEKIYNLEQKRLPIIAEITALQDKNYNYQVNELQPLRDALDARIKNIDTARTAWENQQLAIQAAAFEADKTNDRFKIGEGIVAAIKKLWDDIKDKNITLSVNTVGTPISSAIKAGTQAPDANITASALGAGYKNNAAYQNFRAGERNMYGGFIKKYSSGGSVSGSGMTDSVRAMLTPGEFVMNRAASQKFGPLLERINESKYPDSLSLGGTPTVTAINNNSVNNNNTSVYNYSLSVGVNDTSASPDDIARTVITQIRQMDARRLRGNTY